MKNLKKVAIITTLGLGLLLISCTSYSLKTPKSGETWKFFKKNTSQAKEISDYDFSKLKEGYGLFIFSYEIKGPLNENDAKNQGSLKSGVRVWEYKFDNIYEGDKKKKTHIFTYGEIKDELLVSSQTSSYFVRMDYEFRKNKIVYGGRLFIDAQYKVFRILDYYEDDNAGLFENNKDKLDSIDIERILIELW